MSKSRVRILIIVAVLAALAAIVVYATRPKPVLVRVVPVERGLVEFTVANTRAGTVKACRRAGMAPPSGGQIANLPVKEGDHVHTGQVLLELWNEDLTAQLALARGDANAARSRAEEACIGADVSEREAKRLERLRSSELTSVEAADKAAGQARSSRAACNATLANVTVAEAKVSVASALLERTRLRAPFDATVAEINGELGEFVTPSPVGVPTLPAVDLIDTSCLYVTAPIDEVDAPSVRAGMPARITLDAWPKRKFPGVVRRVAPYVLDVEKQARTVEIEVAFSNLDPDVPLLPGYSADAEIIIDKRADVLRVPTEALLEGGKVLVFAGDGEPLVERTIKTGLANWSQTEVVSGLAQGDKVVVTIDRKGVAAGARARAEPAGATRAP